MHVCVWTVQRVRVCVCVCVGGGGKPRKAGVIKVLTFVALVLKSIPCDHVLSEEGYNRQTGRDIESNLIY